MAKTQVEATATPTNEKTVPANAGNTLEEKAVAAKAATEPAKVFTPQQAVGIFVETLNKDDKKTVLNEYAGLLEDFSNESNTRISIGKRLMHLRSVLGDLYRKFLKDCVLDMLRKSEQFCGNCEALAEAATHMFASNRNIQDALFRIWGAEGCFDATTGKLSPVVKHAITQVGGIPEKSDSQASEVWARNFVRTVDSLLKERRAAQPGGRAKLTAEEKEHKIAGIVKSFATFIKREDVTGNDAINLVKRILVEALVEMPKADLAKAMTQAHEQIVGKKQEIAESAKPATPRVQPAATA